MMPVLCAIFLGLVQSPDLEPFLGSYRADFSRARKHRGVFEAYFGKRAMVLVRDGTFEICGLNQSGYWRKEGDKLILVYRGVFGLSLPDSKESLKRAIPKSSLEGMILRIQPDRTLRLDNLGVAQGPITFSRKKDEPLMTLVRKIGNFEHPDNAESYQLMRNRATSEQKFLVRIAHEPKESYEAKVGAAISLREIQLLKPETSSFLIDALPALQSRNQTAKELGLERIIRTTTIAAILTRPSMRARHVLIRQVELGKVDARQLKPLFLKWKQPEDAALLTEWLNSEQSDRIEIALQILAGANNKVALEKSYSLRENASPQVQHLAHATIARLSPEKLERIESLRFLTSKITNRESPYQINASAALALVQTSESLPYLAASLLAPGTNEFGRSQIAVALGDLGDSRAVPSLLEAYADDSLWRYSEVRNQVLTAIRRIRNAKAKLPRE